MALKFTLFGNTHVGSVRDHNEDNFAVCSDLAEKLWSFSKDEDRSLSNKGAIMIVADGMGGTNAGEVASDIAQNSVKNAFDALETVPSTSKEREQLLKKFILQAHNDIVKHQQDNLETAGMGTTLVIAWIIDDMLHAAWSGDSRCYVYDAGTSLVPFSDDHSIVWELVKKGDLSAEEARLHPNSNIISQSLGDPKSTPKPDVKTRQLYAGNKVLVCSDGLNGMVSDEEIEAYLKIDQNVAQTCRELVDAANAAGGHDNITCLLFEVKEGDKAPIELPKSEPTKTAVLRKKVKYNYAIIAVLVLALGFLAYKLLATGEEKPDKVIALALQNVVAPAEGDFIFDLSTINTSEIDQIQDVKWLDGKFKLSGTELTLTGPISTTDTLFVTYTLKGKEVSYRSSILFIPASADETPESGVAPETAPVGQTPAATPPPARETPNQTRPNLQDQETAPVPQVDTPRTVQPAPRPRLNPIKPDSTN